MSAITIGNNLVHFEYLGRGKPIILVHSWIGSWRYWIPTMQQLATKYRTYALDLWGFGDSGKNRDEYHLEGQVALLRAFVDKLAIPKAVFVGHGLGAAVVTHYAIDPAYRNKVHRMMVVAPPLFDIAPPPSSQRTLPAGQRADAPTVVRPNLSGIDREKLRQAALEAGLDAIAANKETNHSTQNNPETTGQSSESELIFSNPLAEIMGGVNPLTLLNRYVENPSEELRTEVSKTKPEVIDLCTQSFRYISTYHELLQVSSPKLTVLGEHDALMQVPNQHILGRIASGNNSKVIVMPGMQHFPMMEDTTKFVRLLREFLEAPDIASLELKDEWRRRTR